jgi:hypothetical protein
MKSTLEEDRCACFGRPASRATRKGKAGKWSAATEAQAEVRAADTDLTAAVAETAHHSGREGSAVAYALFKDEEKLSRTFQPKRKRQKRPMTPGWSKSARASRCSRMICRSNHARRTPILTATKISIGRWKSRRPDPAQHPLQILLIFRSTWESWEFSDRISASPCIDGPGVAVPSMRPLLVPPAGLPVRPTVVDPCGPAEPLD